MSEENIKFRRKKIGLTIAHIIFLLLTMAGFSAMYLNANYGKGIKWLYNEAYEDSASFCAQLEKDIDRIFTYVGYKNMFETNGKLDLNKPIVGISDGPGMYEEYTLDEIVRYAKKRGYYLDENFIVQGMPVDMNVEKDDGDVEVTVDYQTYNPDFINGDGMGTRITKEELALDILTHLGEYYSIYYNYIEKETNLRFRVEYKNTNGNTRSYTNVPDVPLEELRGAGRYLYIPGNTIRMDSNLSVVPVNVATLLEIWNPYETNTNYMVVSVDTAYPHTDAYSIEAAEYRGARSQFIMGIGGVSVGLTGCLITLALLMLMSGHRERLGDEIGFYPIDKICTETCLFVWALATVVFLCIGRYVGIRILSLFMEEKHWSYWNKMLKLLILYSSSILCMFSMLRRYKAETLWSNSLAKRAIRALKEYLKHATYAFRAAVCYLIFLAFNVIMLWGIIFLFAYRKENIGLYIMLYAGIALYIGVDGWIFHQLFKKSVQRDLLEDAVEVISGGDTSYTIDTARLSGKERITGEHLNNISTGLGAALQQQVKSERLKADLITNVSHDIKTPLTSIINYVDLMKREKIENPKVLGYLEVLDQKSQRLKTLTEDLVEASKASSGNLKLEVSDIDLTELVHQTNGEFEERFALRHLELVSNLPEAVFIIRADGRRLWRVLENLYTNAFKYAMEYSRVYVDIIQQDDNVVFTIKNVSEKPLNISPDELTQRFVRGDVARTTEGSGLGLSIAQSLTQLQKGAFKLEIDGDLFKAEVSFPILKKIEKNSSVKHEEASWEDTEKTEEEENGEQAEEQPSAADN